MPDCISNAELTRARQGVKTANFTLATESFRWLARDEFPVLLPSIPPRDNELYLGRKDMLWLKFGTMGLLPVFWPWLMEWFTTEEKEIKIKRKFK